MPSREVYTDYIRAAGEDTGSYLADGIARWREGFDPHNALFGYGASGAPATAAAVDAFLYEMTGDLAYARRARQALLLPRELSEMYPQEIAARHPEYHRAVPPMDGLFVPPNYVPAYQRVRESGIFAAADHEAIESIVADSLHTLFHFPEWGAHNRAMLRALSLELAAQTFPANAEAGAWHELAGQLAADSWGRWSIEDAMGYHAVWMLALATYADVTGRQQAFSELPTTQYYMTYFAHMLTPLDTFPDFGDCNWGGGAERLLPCFEWAATVYRSPAFKYIADRMATRLMASSPPSPGNAGLLIQAYAWADDTIEPQCPNWRSDELLEDLVGKKVLFRSGWDPAATYMLVNYRDEKGYGAMPRRYLRTTLAVSAEKMHHGHADENAIVLLVSKGAALLHDGGYRETLPNGRYRADIYHNRVIWRHGIKRAGSSAWDFLHDDGRYKATRTEKLHFERFRGLDLSRTRVTDAQRGIAWDRVIAYVHALGCFIVVDAVRALESGPFTLANVLYTSSILASGETHFDTAIDTIGSWENPQQQALAITYPLTEDRPVSAEAVRRHYQQETGLFQVWTGWLAQGDTVPFVTVLWPHDQDSHASLLADAISLPDVSHPGQSVAVAIQSEGHAITFGCKLDLDLGLLQQDIRPRYDYETGKVRYGAFETDASHVYVDITTTHMRAAFTEATQLHYRNTPLYQAGAHRMFQEDGTNSRITPSWRRVWQEDFDVSEYGPAVTQGDA